MRKKGMLMILLATLIATAVVTINLPATTAQEKASIALDPFIIDTRNLKEVGDTFSINATIANINELWGYQFSVHYNTSVVNATNYVFLDDRFQYEQPSELGIDFVSCSQGTFTGDETGITITDPTPVVRLDFIVTGEGTTALTFNPNYSTLAKTFGREVKPVMVSGKFSNTQLLEIHDVGVNEASISATSGKPGDKITINAVVSNQGGFTETITVTANYNMSSVTGPILVQIGETQTITGLAKDTSSDELTFTWDTAGVAEGAYEVTVKAAIPTDDKTSDNTRIAGIVTLKTGGGGGIPTYVIYIAAGLGIVAIAGIAVYALRARKSS